jgi:hypothetical protein
MTATPKPRQVTITRTSKNGAARIQDALHRGHQVMAKADNWFRVVSFREEVTADGYRLWYATGEPRRGHEWARDLFMTTVTWKESDDGRERQAQA